MQLFALRHFLLDGTVDSYVYVLSARLCKLCLFHFLFSFFLFFLLLPACSFCLVLFLWSHHGLPHTLCLSGQMLPITQVNTQKLLFEVAVLQNSTNMFQFLFVTDVRIYFHIINLELLVFPFLRIFTL